MQPNTTKEDLSIKPKLNDEANSDHQQACGSTPDNFDDHFDLAKSYQSHAKYTASIYHYQKAIQLKPDHSDAYNNLGCVFNQLQRFDRAIRCFQQAVSLEPEFAEAYYNLGVALRSQGNIKGALSCFKLALQIEPNFALAHHAVGNLFQQESKMAEATFYYQRAIQIDPNFCAAHYNLGNALKACGKLDEAIACYHSAIALKPDFAQAYNNKGLVLKDQDKFDAALNCFEQALAIKSDLVEAYYNMALTLHSCAKLEEGLQWTRKATHINPDYAPAKWFYHLALPILYETQTDMIHYRQRFTAQLDRLVAETKLVTPEQKIFACKGIGSMPNFYLAYQGQNDRALQKKYGEFVVRIMAANYPEMCRPLKLPPVAPNTKIRVGYVSSFMRAHTVGEFLLGWIENHNQRDFEIFCYHIGAQSDGMTAKFEQHADHFHQVHDNLESAARQIISDNLHILVFTDIGMYAPATQLAACRLAPIQCKGWGHPVTTGLPTIDYYLSSQLMEPEDAQKHYAEQLVKLPNLALAYQKPLLPRQPKTREAFGIRPEAFVYLISQSLFKLLPQYDHVYSQIAQAVPDAQFVFISHSSAEITDRLRNRLDATFQRYNQTVDDCCLFLPRLSFQDFLSLNLASNVLLDTFSWSGGKTTLEAISCALPVVTCPGEFMRGRHAYAMLKMMGVEETIAKDVDAYIQLAVKLAKNREFYLNVKRLMSENQSKIYNDREFMQGLEDFYRRLIHGNRPRGQSDNAVS